MIGPRIQTRHRIRIAREAARFSQRSLAEALGTNQRKIQHWETGHTSISDYELTRLARVCGVDTEWLTTGGNSRIEFREICPVCRQDVPLVGVTRIFATHPDKAGWECPMGAKAVAA